MSEAPWRPLTRLPLGEWGSRRKTQGSRGISEGTLGCPGLMGDGVWTLRAGGLCSPSSQGRRNGGWPLTLFVRETPRERGCGQRRGAWEEPEPRYQPLLYTVLHSWVGQSPGARAALLWALAAALERREPTLALRLERHGAEPKAAKAEVELSMRRLRAWGARAQAQSHSLLVRGVSGQSGGGQAKALE